METEAREILTENIRVMVIFSVLCVVETGSSPIHPVSIPFILHRVGRGAWRPSQGIRSQGREHPIANLLQDTITHYGQFRNVNQPTMHVFVYV